MPRTQRVLCPVGQNTRLVTMSYVTKSSPLAPRNATIRCDHKGNTTKGRRLQVGLGPRTIFTIGCPEDSLPPPTSCPP